MTRILLTGKNGQVGWDLQRTLATVGEVTVLDRRGMDLADPDSIRRAVRDHKPNLIVNAAAYTAVDKAEEEPDLALAINGVAPGIMAEEAKRLGAALIHYSTDYVFDGDKDSPYTEDDEPNPLNVYGKTKLEGERAIAAVGLPHLILRTSWVYGARGKNFLLTILRLARERDELRVVNDQIGAPTWSRMIAEVTGQILQLSISQRSRSSLNMTELSGIYNLSASGQTSWHGFATAIMEEMEAISSAASYKLRPSQIHPILAKDYPLPAHRPQNSLLNHQKINADFSVSPPHWRQSVKQCLEDMACKSKAAAR